MAQINFCGPSYTSQSTVADAERCLNLYPEAIEGNGKGPLALYPTPGLFTIITLALPGSTAPARVRGLLGMYDPVVNRQRVFAVVGPQAVGLGIAGGFYEITVTAGIYGSTLLGTLPETVGTGATIEPLVSMTSGGTGQVLIAVDGQTYYYSSALGFNTLPVLATFNGNVSEVGYCDGFFLALNAPFITSGNQFWASAPLDVTTWPGASTAKVSVFPDIVQSMVVNQRQVWMLGRQASVVYYDSGNFPFPFDVIDGSYMEQGCIAKASAVKLDNSIFWLGGDPRGQAIVWRANGYTPQRVSNHAVEFAMQGYGVTPTVANRFANGINDAIGYAYQDQGHSFYVLYLPSANSGNGATRVYDAATNSWHERSFLNETLEQAHRSQCHVACTLTDLNTNVITAGIHLVGDWASGSIYQMAIPSSNGSGGWNFATDFGNPIKRLRRAPVVNIEKEWMRYDELKLDMDVGLGPMPPLTDTNLVAFNDNFNRANGPLGVNWTVLTGFNPAQIAGNQVEPSSVAGPDTVMAFTGGPILGNQLCSIQVVQIIDGASAVGACVRMSLAGTFYVFLITGPLGAGCTGELFYITSAVETQIGPSIPLTVNTGDIIGLEAVTNSSTGITTLNCYRNGIIVLAQTDSHIATGYQGFLLAGDTLVTDAVADNFVGQNDPQPRDPQVMLRWSKDNANTWSNQQFMGAGQAGDYTKQVRMSRMGRARQMTFEVSCTDPIPWRFVNAYLKATAYQPEERLVRKLGKSA